MSNKRNLQNAVLTGTVPAILEVLLILATGPAISLWVLIQSILFWFGCGFVVYLARLQGNKIISSVLITVLLNMPWYIALSVVANKPNYLIPLIIASIILGGVIGLVSQILERRLSTSGT